MSTVLPVAIGDQYWMSDAAVAEYFARPLEDILEIPETMSLESLVHYWAKRLFDDVSFEFELMVVRVIVRRLEELDPHIASRAFTELSQSLDDLDSSCRHPESVRILKDCVAAVSHLQSAPHVARNFHAETGAPMIGGELAY